MHNHHRPNGPASAGWRVGPSATNSRSVRPLPLQYHDRKSQFSPPNYYQRDHPPGPKPRPNFVIHLSALKAGLKKADFEDLIGKFKCRPENYDVFFARGNIAGSLFFQQWSSALETMVQLWETRLSGDSWAAPRLVQNVIVQSDCDELKDRLKQLFVNRARTLIEGELVQKWQNKLGALSNEIKLVSDSLRKRRSLSHGIELFDKMKGLSSEEKLILKKINEFKSAMRSITANLETNVWEDGNDEDVQVFKFDKVFDWDRIHSLIMRESRRLDDGLPIYASRQEILRQIRCQQVILLTGETGSGKSTQLVQFLADSGVAGEESIICTQPRKLAAISLMHRVREESVGCYQHNSIVCYPSYSSSQHFVSKVIYMTDHCLLQHYMNDRNLSGISCIIVDEAHERSLNTDLLLALLKDLLCRRPDLRLIIMSATADENQLADYFFGCGTCHVVGRNFPVEIRYVPCSSEATSNSGLAPYVSDVLRMVTEIHRTEKEGTILAFLTSQMEVEWACENFRVPLAVALPLHGKLSHEDQHQVFLHYPGRRKVIFSTNLAETSLTIPGVKYVVDSGMVKEARFEPGTGMNVLRVCRISMSSAKQRAGRAGRTEPGRCYRLYSENDFESMPPHQEPEIRRVHLGVAVLRILALGMKNVMSFEFIDAPSSDAIDMAIRNLVQLGAVTVKSDVYELTDEGRWLVRLGVEPRLGKLILNCFYHRLGREGLVLAAVMANASSIFCRIGSEQDKLKSDCLKVQFCHQNGDLFTLLSVYKEWESMPLDKRNKWCWDNSINAKSMRRCFETVQELESCLQNELNIIVPSYWLWNPHVLTEHDKILKKVILSSLAENVAMYSGYDQLGYEVALTGKHVQLHPSCSLLIFSQRPRWVVFGEVLSTLKHYLVCVTSFDFESLATLCPSPLFDVSKMDSQKLDMRELRDYGSTLLKRFCGKHNSSLHHLLSKIRTACKDERIGIEVNVDHNNILLYASSRDMLQVFRLVNDVLEHERKLLQNECLEKCLYLGGTGVSSSLALFGAGAEIKHLELEKRCLTVDVFHSNLNSVDDKELLMFLERNTSGKICAVHKLTGIGQDGEEKEKWGRVTFLTLDAAERATEVNQVEFSGGLMRVVPARSTYGGDHKMFSFPPVQARVFWLCRQSKGVAFVKCETPLDVEVMIEDFSNLLIGSKHVRCGRSMKFGDSVMISGLDRELSEAEILEALCTATNRRILELTLLRYDAVENPPLVACEEALLREISSFMPKRSPHGNSVRVQVFPPESRGIYMKALITFDGSLHLEAARALEHIEGKALPGFHQWQKINCRQWFHSNLSCPADVFFFIEDQLRTLLSSFKRLKGAKCSIETNENGSYRVKIAANATRTVAQLRRPLEQLMRGKIVEHSSLTPTVLQLLFSSDGVMHMKSIQREMGTCILFDRHNLNIRVFGPSHKIDMAERKLVESLLKLHERKQLEIHLRGGNKPPDLMKKAVEKFGPDLHGLREKVPGVNCTLNAKCQIIIVDGDIELKRRVETIIFDIAQTPTQGAHDEAACPICLCEVEDKYQLEGCGHEFCRSCLVEQCVSAINNKDSFPLCCTHEGCGAHILITDLKSLLSSKQLEDLFRASLGAFVAASGGIYRFCPSPDCPSVYRAADPGTPGTPFVCGACCAETCTRCHLEYHPCLSCEKYQEFKEDPDTSLKEWCKGKDHVKHCPVCGFTIEKVDGCNHVECRCGRHICWVCLEFFGSSDDCYDHLRSVHLTIT